MRRTASGFGRWVGVVVLLAGCGGETDRTASPDAEAARVLAGLRRAVNADTVRTLEAYAACDGPDGRFLTRVLVARDGRLRFEQRRPDGSAFIAGIPAGGATADGWIFDRDTMATSTLDDTTRAFLRGHAFHMLAMLPEALAGGGRFVGASSFEGEATAAVEFRDALGSPLVLHLSPTDTLPVGLVETNHTGRGVGEVRVRFQAWRTIGGVRVFSLATIHHGEDVYTFRYLDVRVNETPDAAFSAPREPWAGVAAADRPEIRDGRDVIRAMRAAYDDAWYRGLFIEQAVVSGGNPPESAEIWTELLSLPGRVRSDVGDPEAGNVEIYVDGTQTLFRDGERAFQGNALHTVLALGFDACVQDPESTIVRLTANGWNLDALAETVRDGRPAWIVGGAPDDSAAKRFWVDREQLLYLGHTEVSRVGNLIEVKVGDYEPGGGGWVATTFHFLRNGAPVFDETYRRYRVLDRIPARVYDTDTLRSAPAAWTIAAPTP